MTFYNLACVTTATAGTGTITLGPAIAGFLTFAQAGVPNGGVVTYAILDGVNSEVGTGTYTLSGTTLTRDTVYRSTGAANVGKINLSGSAQVVVSPAAEDLNRLSVTSDVTFNSLTVGGVSPVSAIDYGGSLVTLSAPRMVYVGESLTAGGAVPFTRYISLSTYKGKSFSTQNLGVGGSTVASWQATEAKNRLDPLYQWQSPVNIVLIWLGTNDIATGSSAATVWTNLQALAAAEKALGFKVGIGTSISRVSNDTNLTTLNGLITAGWVAAGIDFLVDFGGNANLSPNGVHYSDLFYYGADQIHLNDTGEVLVGSIAQAAINTYIGTLSTTPTPTVFPTYVAPAVWTPTDGSGASLSLTIAYAKYSKVGKVNTLSFGITYPATGSGAAAAVSGVPFAPEFSGGGAPSYTNVGSVFTIMIASNSFQFYDMAGATLPNSALSGKIIYATFTYISAS